MDEMTVAITSVLETLTGQPLPEATVDPARPADLSSRAWAKLQSHVQQNPMRHEDREALLNALSRHRSSEMPDELAVKVLSALNRYRVRIPLAERRKNDPLVLPPLPPPSDAALRIISELDEEVEAPFTIVGGQMVFLHVVENDYPWRRTTEDADIAINVYTHRPAVREITGLLIDHYKLDDLSPVHRDSSWSYKFGTATTGVEIDVVAPEGVAEKLTVRPPRTATGGNPVGMAGMQSAIKRTERVEVEFDDGQIGHLRRPDLLGAIAVKSAAALRDSDPGRHLEDLGILFDLVATSPRLSTFRAEITTRQRARLAKVANDIVWLGVADQRRAKSALAILLH